LTPGLGEVTVTPRRGLSQRPAHAEVGNTLLEFSRWRRSLEGQSNRWISPIDAGIGEQLPQWIERAGMTLRTHAGAIAMAVYGMRSFGSGSC